MDHVDRVSCAHCGRTTERAGALGWSLSTPPRPVGAQDTPGDGRLTALCPDCARRALRDLEARLDP